MSAGLSVLLGETRIYFAIHCRACVLPWSRTSVYAPCGKSAPFASCLYLRVLTVYVFARQSETRIQAKQSLSLPAADSSLCTKEPGEKRFCNLFSFTQGSLGEGGRPWDFGRNFHDFVIIVVSVGISPTEKGKNPKGENGRAPSSKGRSPFLCPFGSVFVCFLHFKKTGRAEGVEMRRFGKKILKIPKNFSKGYGQKRFYVVNYGKTDS